MGFRIKEYAFERGMKMGDLARELRMPLSNLSGIASGKRSVSLALLGKIAAVLKCSMPDLFAEAPTARAGENAALTSRVFRVERANYMGREKGWTHRLMIARLSHYQKAVRPRSSLAGLSFPGCAGGSRASTAKRKWIPAKNMPE